MITTTTPQTAAPATARTSDEPLRYDSAGRPVWFSGRAPEGLATRRQLRAAGLSDAGLRPVAWIHTYRHTEGPLFDPAQARPLRPLTDKQRQALAEGRKKAHLVTCRSDGCEATFRYRAEDPDSDVPAGICGKCEARWWDETEQQQIQDWIDDQEATEAMIQRDHDKAGAWAAAVLADEDAVVLDTETTGLYGAYMVQIAIVEIATGTVLMDTLVNPQTPIPPEATRIHGITDADVASAPRFGDILPSITRALNGRRVIIYNASFDCGILHNELQRYWHDRQPMLPGNDITEAYGSPALDHAQTTAFMESFSTECAMEAYAAWAGQWSEYHGSYTWQPLGGGHTALSDCQTVIKDLHTMAASITKSTKELVA